VDISAEAAVPADTSATDILGAIDAATTAAVAIAVLADVRTVQIVVVSAAAVALEMPVPYPYTKEPPTPVPVAGRHQAVAAVLLPAGLVVPSAAVAVVSAADLMSRFTVDYFCIIPHFT
jgi:hypothetical protein